MKRQLEGFWKHAHYCIAVIFGGLYVYTAGFGLITTELHRGMYLMFNSVLALIVYASTKKAKKVNILDIILILLAVVSFGYWIMEYRSYAFRSGTPTTYDTVFGIIAIVVLLEVTRRVMGWVLVSLAVLFLTQLYFGPYLPGVLSHRGFSVVRIIEFTYSTMEGIFGVITDTFATFVFPFIILGAFFEISGAGDFFINLANSITKGWIGGPAKMSVMASGLFGSISGSSVANTVATGAFTIPMMKKIGFAPEEAGGIEAAASTGGQFLPPVMGAGAFLLAVFAETSYLRVAAMNIIPALLYFYWVGWSIHHRASRFNIKGLDDDEIPNIGETLKSGWYFFIPLIMVVAVLMRGYTPSYAAFYAIIATIVLSWINPKNRITLKKFFDGLALGAKNNLVVGATIGTLGMVMAGIILAGLGSKFAYMLVYLARGNLFFTIVLLIIVATFIGMGATQTATYIVVSLIAVPALATLGISRLIGHIISFWVAAVSNVTPPVCVSAYAAAGIAKSDPMKTGIAGLKYCTMIYVIPFTFIYFPQMLLQGTTFEIAYITILYLIAIPVATAAFQGYWRRKLTSYERVFFIALGLGLIIPRVILNVPILILFMGYVIYNKYILKDDTGKNLVV